MSDERKKLEQMWREQAKGSLVTTAVFLFKNRQPFQQLILDIDTRKQNIKVAVEINGVHINTFPVRTRHRKSVELPLNIDRAVTMDDVMTRFSSHSEFRLYGCKLIVRLSRIARFLAWISGGMEEIK